MKDFEILKSHMMYQHIHHRVAYNWNKVYIEGVKQSTF